MLSSVGRTGMIGCAAAALVTAASGCAEIFGIDEWTPIDGGSSDAGGTASSAGGQPQVSGPCTGVELEQIAGDCRRMRCDSGSIVTDPDPGDRPDDGLECTEDVCQGGTVVHTARALGTPCGGGACDGEGACVECVAGIQCPSGVCLDLACAAPSCSDDVQNGAETDVDCGGDCGKRCEEGQGCAVEDDCKKGECADGVCED